MGAKDSFELPRRISERCCISNSRPSGVEPTVLSGSTLVENNGGSRWDFLRVLALWKFLLHPNFVLIAPLHRIAKLANAAELGLGMTTKDDNDNDIMHRELRMFVCGKELRRRKGDFFFAIIITCGCRTT